MLLLVVEIGALVAVLLQFAIWPLDTYVVHDLIWLTTTVVSTGVGLIGALLILRVLKKVDGVQELPKIVNMFLAFMGVGILALGGVLVWWTFPEVMRFSGVMDGNERWRHMKAVSVRLDMNGGVGRDDWRIVRNAGFYGQTMNVYPSEDERQMRLNAAKIDLHEGWIVVESDCGELTDYETYVNYFTSNTIPYQAMGDVWTYVVDMADISGSFSRWVIGQTWDAEHEVFAQLQLGTVDPAIRSGEKRFLVLKSEKWGERFNLLDRAFIQLSPRQRLKARFRVSLFAGNCVDESNYHYVKPGETIECPLPTPTRDGYVFEGWYDGDRRITEDSRVEKQESHTLKARWRKL